MNDNGVLSLPPFYSLQFVVLKEHQNLGDGHQPVVPQDGQAADVGQFFSLEHGEWLSLPSS